MIVGDKVWELSSYIEQYLPDLFDIYPMDTVGSWWDKEGLTNADGKIYTIATALNPIYLDDFVEDTDPERYARIQPPSDTIGGNGYIWVRDDILKMIYPEAKTQQEIEDIFMANGVDVYKRQGDFLPRGSLRIWEILCPLASILQRFTLKMRRE